MSNYLQYLFENKRTNQIDVSVIDLDRDDWIKFKNKIQPGDEVWGYNDSKPLSGSFGYLLVRNGNAVDWFVEARR